MNIAIVIPIFNEASNLERLAKELALLSPQPNQVVLVDGGSHDGSLAIAQKLGFSVINSERGRASQQNAGAWYVIEQVSDVDVLLFLHADTQLPNDAIQLIQQAYQKQPSKFWGRFDVRLNSDDWLLQVVGFMINKRSRITRIATGDQAIFIAVPLFKDIDGFANIPLMEDVAICKTLRRISKPVCLRQKVITSARRWNKYGRVKTILLMWQLRFEYWLGVSPDKLATKYGYKPKNK